MADFMADLMAEKVLSGWKERGGLWCGSLSMICIEDEREI